MQKLGGMQAIDEPYRDVPLARMVRRRAGRLTALFLGEMLTATAMAGTTTAPTTRSWVVLQGVLL